VIFIEVAKIHEIAVGEVQLDELDRKETLVMNVGGQSSAAIGRCLHSNARLSMGRLETTTIS
jgi:nitrite reductase/ring-hydroxylating ferredoxin subunit